MREALVLYWRFLYHNHYLFYHDCHRVELRPLHFYHCFSTQLVLRTCSFKFGLVKRVSYNYRGGIGIGISILM